ncbi:MAG: hypothetical protein P1T08_08770 [Acidimicrobiia bacterium]|nr:hypothetical protein [Acidimicrobiia bacterium]
MIGDPVAELQIQGGHSTEDILSECLKALLTKPPEQVTESWEAVAFGIATNKTKGALRDGQAWLRATRHRPKLTMVSGDNPGPEGADGTLGRSLFEGIAATGPDLEEQFFATAQQLELIKLAHELLDDRDRTIFLGLHTGERSRDSLANEFDLSPPGVTYVYRRIAQRLYDHPRFQRFTQGGNR